MQIKPFASEALFYVFSHNMLCKIYRIVLLQLRQFYSLSLVFLLRTVLSPLFCELLCTNSVGVFPLSLPFELFSLFHHMVRLSTGTPKFVLAFQIKTFLFLMRLMFILFICLLMYSELYQKYYR